MVLSPFHWICVGEQYHDFLAIQLTEARPCAVILSITGSEINMPALSSDLRKNLENAIMAARRASEDAASAALTTLAVSRTEAFGIMSEAQRQLRRDLRAKAAQLGDDVNPRPFK
jgi:hypothetical protein